MKKLVPRKWASFQHYRDRAPSWIKLHKELLDDFEFQRLPVESRALAPMLWLLASERPNGEIDFDLDEIAFRLRQPVDSVRTALQPLLGKDGKGGFFSLEDGASAPLADPEHAASPEKRREEEEKEGEGEEDPQAPAPALHPAPPPPPPLPPPPKPRAAPAPDPARRLTVRDVVAESGGSEKHVKDWFAARKGVALTQSAWDAFQREAKSAGYTLPEAIQACAENEWRGFRAAYVRGKPKPKPAGADPAKKDYGDAGDF